MAVPGLEPTGLCRGRADLCCLELLRDGILSKVWVGESQQAGFAWRGFVVVFALFLSLSSVGRRRRCFFSSWWS